MIFERMTRLNIALVALIVFTLAALACVHVRWGYDEFGAVVSHLELDDPAFLSEYQHYAETIGLRSPAAQVFFMHVVLPIAVVPIRWTYAIGISPWLEIARVLPLDWPLLKPILLLPSIALATVGLWLALCAVALRTVERGGLPVFLALLAASPPLFWWTVSISSYSHHLFCFGLLMHASLAPARESDSRWTGCRGLARAAAPIFNYQYLPVVAMLGLFDFARSPRVFVVERRYRAWGLSLVVCVGSAVFLAARSRISGKHGSPTTAALSPDQVLAFNFPAQATSPFAALEMLAARYVDIAYSFFFPDSGVFTVLGLPGAFAVTAALASLLVFAARQLDRGLFTTLIAMLLGTTVLHLAGVMPLSPSRHQLVMFLPLAMLVALCAQQVTQRWLPAPVLPLLALGSALVVLGSQLRPVFAPAQGMPQQVMRETLARAGVQRLVLSPCELEPLLYPDIHRQYSPLYRCGPKVRHQLSDEVSHVAVWSASPLDASKAAAVLTDYSRFDWVLRPLSAVSDSETGFGPRGHLYLAERSPFAPLPTPTP